FGLAVLACLKPGRDIELFRTLARHDEFTRYCVPGILNFSDDSESELWTLAQNVFGWGRINTIENLQYTQRPEIQEWLLREGYKTSAGETDLANLCATTGRLHI